MPRIIILHLVSCRLEPASGMWDQSSPRRFFTEPVVLNDAVILLSRRTAVEGARAPARPIFARSRSCRSPRSDWLLNALPSDPKPNDQIIIRAPLLTSGIRKAPVLRQDRQTIAGRIVEPTCCEDLRVPLLPLDLIALPAAIAAWRRRQPVIASRAGATLATYEPPQRRLIVRGQRAASSTCLLRL